MDSGRITAQLGCGALLLVIVAAYVGAVAGTEGIRPGAGRANTLPPMFREGNLVVMSTGQGRPPGVPVMRVLAVSGTWVKLRIDLDASAARARATGEAPDDEDADIRLYFEIYPLQGDWWVNTAVTDTAWSEYALE